MSLAVVQSANHVFGNTSPGSVTLGATPTLGNLLIAFVHQNGTPTAANGWSLIGSIINGTTNNLHAFYRYVQSGDTTALPAIGTGGNYNDVTVYEISGVNGTWANDFDGFGSLPASGTSLKNTFAIPTNGDLVFVSASHYSSSVTPTDTSGLLTIAQSGNNSSQYGSWLDGYYIPAGKFIKVNVTTDGGGSMVVLALNQTGAGLGQNPMGDPTTYFVDPSATGAADGLTPADAFTDIRSALFVPGGKYWVRRTASLTFTNSEFFPTQTLPSGFGDAPVANKYRTFVIGWPDVQDPFYDQRPIDATSAGWDADVPATAVYSGFGYKWPALYSSNSGNWGVLMHISAFTTLANFYAVNCGGIGHFPAIKIDINDSEVCLKNIVDNVLFSYCNTVHPSIWSGPKNSRVKLQHTIWPIVDATTVAFNFVWDVEHVEVHSFSNVPYLFTPNSFFVQRLTNWSSSVGYIFNGNTASDNWPLDVDNFNSRCRRVEGVKPISADISSHSWDSDIPVSFDDYYGEGPRIISDRKRQGWTMVTSVFARVNGGKAIKFEIGTTMGAANYWTENNAGVPMIEKVFDVTSGTPIGIRVPIYVDSTAAFKPNYGSMRATLMAKGAHQQRGLTATGTADVWSGNLTTGGHAYTHVFTFHPQESGPALFQFYQDNWTHIASGVIYAAYALFGEPY